MAKPVYTKKFDTVFVLIIFFVFALSSFMVLTLGANIYMAAAEKSQQGQDDRTGLSYIWTKVKHNDVYQQITVKDFNGQPALCLEEEADGVYYETWIYHHDGWLCELYCEKGITLSPDSGNPLVKVGTLLFSEPGNGLLAVKTDSGALFISPRGKGGIPFD